MCGFTGDRRRALSPGQAITGSCLATSPALWPCWRKRRRTRHSALSTRSFAMGWRFQGRRRRVRVSVRRLGRGQGRAILSGIDYSRLVLQRLLAISLTVQGIYNVTHDLCWIRAGSTSLWSHQLGHSGATLNYYCALSICPHVQRRSRRRVKVSSGILTVMRLQLDTEAAGMPALPTRLR